MSTATALTVIFHTVGFNRPEDLATPAPVSDSTEPKATGETFPVEVSDTTRAVIAAASESGDRHQPEAPALPRLEILPCINEDGSITSGMGIADEDAQFFGLYVVGKNGLSDHVRDFSTRAAAELHAAALDHYAERLADGRGTITSDGIDIDRYGVYFHEAGDTETIGGYYDTKEHAATVIGYIRDRARQIRIEKYNARIDAKRERYGQLAEKHAAAADARYQASRKTLDMIPFGQPILVGHHSEGKHRRAIEKAHNNMRASIQHRDTAAHYEDKAENYGTHGISGADPAAIDKMKKKIADLEERRELAKKGNAYWRKHKTLVGCPGLSDELIAAGHKTMAQGYSWIKSPFSTEGTGAEIRRIRDRIAGLEKTAAKGTIREETASYIYEEDAEENRANFYFDGKPESVVRDILKRNGFKWSPSRNAWTRILNNAARWSADRVKAAINGNG